jgi:arylsulfatase A-like enzyme
MARILHIICSITILLTFTYCQQSETSAEEQKAPNIIFILTDDLGYGDLGILFQNQREAEGKPFHRTPQLDKMAEEGILLTRHYVPAPVCAPSRASLLNGIHQGHEEIRNNQFDKALADNHTLATVLKEAGYVTAIVGKYGLQGTNGNSPQTWEAYPTNRGFDYFFGYVRHRDGHNHYPAHHAPERPPVELYSGDDEISSQLKGCYTTDLFTAMAKKWIVDHKNNNPDKPFFMYLAHNTPHAGLQIASTPYPEGGGLQGGVQWIGEPGNYINTVIDTVDTWYHPDYADQNWPDVQKRIASMIRRIDDGVGDVLQLLKDLGIDQETLVVFTSDNGPHHESYGYGDYQPTFFDSYGPLDGTKRDTWEGGIRVPTIARWPGNIPAGEENDTPTGFHDWMPTFAQLANVPAPARTDGVSLVPLLTGKGEQIPGIVYIEYSVGGATPNYPRFHESHKGQRRGEMQVIYLDGYKGIRYDINSHEDDFRIYDTQKDPGEVNDLAATSNYFKGLQQQMKKRILQLRRPNPTAPRPYDALPMPAIEAEQAIFTGLEYQLFETESPWVPDVNTLKIRPVRTGISKGLDPDIGIRKNNIVIAYKGLLQVPKTAEYSFTLQTEGGAVMRLHDALIIDADKKYVAGSTVNASVILEEGYHPIHVIYKRGTEARPSISLEWSGPDFSQEQVRPTHFFHAEGKEVVRK